MKRPPPEPVQVVKERRDAALSALVGRVPYIRFLGLKIDRKGDELTAVMPFDANLIGNPALPALHGGATAAFLEITAVIELAWTSVWPEVESGAVTPEDLARDGVDLPRTIDITVDYLRTGLPRDAYARARIVRSGRRYASVQAEAWQDNFARPIAQATVHFLMPSSRRDG